jgi:K+/H+ antiporter YhaU regulatory subunit KhtT
MKIIRRDDKLFSVIVLIFSICLLFWVLISKAHAEEICQNPEFIYNQEQINDVLYMGEKLQACEQLVQSQDTEIKEQDKRYELQALENEAYKKANEALEKAVDAYEKTSKLKDEVQEIKDTQCKEDIKKAKPTFWHQLGVFTQGIVVGIGITIIGVLAL